MAAAADNRNSRYLGPKDDVLLFQRLRAQEALGRPYELNVDLVSERAGVRPADLLGETAAVEISDGGQKRYFHGCITAMEARGSEGRYHRYGIILRPWFALLDYTADCRIFQEQTAVEIIEAVFQAHGFSDYELALSDSPPARTYCVQYQETSFAFVSRLMEEEGIYYYFRHERNKHVMVLADDPSSHSPDRDYPVLAYHDAERSAQVREPHVSRLTASGRITSGPIETLSYDFAAPRKDLKARAEVAFSPSLAELEVFTYSGRYTESRAGDRLALVRAQAESAQREVYRGIANAPAIAVGNLLTIKGHPDETFDREYLVTSVEAEAATDDYQGRAPDVDYRCAFTLIPSSVVYRSVAVTPRPLARGLQTARVVGKSGEEIWTDKYGRVKVRFHWDRHGRSDENSSCWVRVSQVHAGSGWGAIDLPRVGEEVVVAFEDGDPDRPVVIGRLYNGQAMPPYALPDNQTKSGVKTSSSKGGGGFNELRFEDKKGEEEVYLRAEKDLNALVRNDRSLEVGHDQTRKIENNDTTEIGGDQKLTVAKEQTLDVKGNRKLSVGKSLDVDVTDQITFKTGQSKIVMKNNGDIEISGVKIQIKGMQEIKLKSSLDLKMEGTVVDMKASAKMSLKAALLDLGANAMAKLKGALTMIG